jgi:hypothetical protein
MGSKLLAFLFGVIVTMLVTTVHMGLRWTPLQAHYFHQYISSVAYNGKGAYSLLFVRYPDGWRMALNKDVVSTALIRDPARLGLFALSDQARRAGANGLEWRFFPELEDATAEQWLRQRIYDGKSPWDFVRAPVLTGLIFAGLFFTWTTRRKRKAERERKEGRIIRGPHLVYGFSQH